MDKGGGKVEEKARFQLRLPEELIERIKIQAIKERRNVNEIIEELLEKYLEENDKK